MPGKIHRPLRFPGAKDPDQFVQRQGKNQQNKQIKEKPVPGESHIRLFL